MRKLILLSVLASVALAQGKVAPRDAGVGAVRASAAVDGGVSFVSSGPTPEVEKLRKEVNDLKIRTAELERAQQAKADSLTSDLEKMGKKVEDLKAQLKVLSDAEARRSDAEEAVATKKSQTAAASSNLNAVLVQLASGNTSGIDASLRYAESVYSGAAQKDVQLARAALAQGDVASARQYLVLALLETEAQR